MKRTTAVMTVASIAFAITSQAKLPCNRETNEILRSVEYPLPLVATVCVPDGSNPEKSKRWIENERWIEKTLAQAGFNPDTDAQTEIIELQRAKEDAERAEKDAQRAGMDARTQIKIVEDQNSGDSDTGNSSGGGSFSFSTSGGAVAPVPPTPPTAPAPPAFARGRHQNVNVYRSGSHNDKALVIRSTPIDAKTLAACEEDLNIMGRILEKALDKTGAEDEDEQAMGIHIVTMTMGSGHAKRLQIEDYGALFMLSVNFPLVGPPVKATDGETTNASNSTWDEAKHEIYGRPTITEDSMPEPFAREKFDAKRVEKLKDSLLAALKNASNMRNLKSDETVTVVVTSGGGENSDYAGGFQVQLQQQMAVLKRSLAGLNSSGGGGSSGGYGAPMAVSVSATPESPDNSVLTITAKKSEIDAFAKGRLTLEEFKKKAVALIY